MALRYPGCSSVDLGQVVVEKKDVNVKSLQTENMESERLTRTLCQVWLKLAHWFRRIRCLNICQCIFLIIRFYIPVEKGFTIEQTWIPFTRGWFVPSLFGNRPSDSGEEDFKILTMYFSYFVIIPPPLGNGLILTKLNSSHPKMLCVKIG